MDIPFFKPQLSSEAINLVNQTLESGWLTTGKLTAQFEKDFVNYKQGGIAIGLTSCSAALHLGLLAAQLPKGAEVIVPSITFPATASMAIHAGLSVVFADIDPKTMTLCPKSMAEKITQHTRAVIPVHVAGNMCNMDAILDLAQKHKLLVLEDCAHALESTYQGTHSGLCGDMGAFSFYATKNLTTAEGGMLLDKHNERAEQIRLLRSHGIDREIWKRKDSLAYQQYDVLAAGFKYNMFDVQAAIGIAELKHLNNYYQHRQKLYQRYEEALSGDKRFTLLKIQEGSTHAFHLFMVLLNLEQLSLSRDEVMKAMKEKGVGTSVHFFPVHLYSYFRETYHYSNGYLPKAEESYLRLLSLPLYPTLSEAEQDYVIQTLRSVVR